MKILFIGDIVGRPGREAVAKVIPKLKEKHEFDLIMGNAENIAHGRGISPSTIEDLEKAGMQFFTTGNHIFANKNGLAKMDDKKFPAVRPANFPPGNPGRGYDIYETGKMQKILIINLMGRVFLSKDYDCPFRTVDKILQETAHEHISATIVDIHAEATSEKVAIGRYLDGKVSAVLGTHTHIPTADAQVLPEGTAYITDVGMVGLQNSILGVDPEPVIKGFLTQMPMKFEISDGHTIFNSVILEIDESTGKAENITQEIELIND